MSERFKSQKRPCGNVRELLKERIDKSNPLRNLTAAKSKLLNKLEPISEKLKRGENVHNRQMQTCLSEI